VKVLQTLQKHVGYKYNFYKSISKFQKDSLRLFRIFSLILGSKMFVVLALAPRKKTTPF